MLTLILFILAIITAVIYLINVNSKETKNQIKNNGIISEKDRINELNKRILASHFGLARKGETGENYIELMLINLDIPKKIIRNAYIPYNGTTAEIDLILITEYGIYVIESKNYSGWIFGSATGKQWTQSLNKRSKYKFYNPILQNKTHIKALSNYLNIELSKFNSFIVFGRNSELKKVPSDTKDYKIIHDYQINECINNNIARKNKIFTEEYMKKIYDLLLPTVKVSNEVIQQHNEIARRYK